jgi:hypothetical protein
MRRFGRACRLVILLIVLFLAVAAWMGQALLAAPCASAAPGFTDLGGQEWYAEAALALEDQGVISPRPDGSFGPHDFVSRGEMAVYLDRLLNLQGDPSLPFTDVNAYDWYAGAVGDLYAAGLVSGTSADTFSPDAQVNRQQAASFIMRALEFSRASRSDLAGIDLLPEETQPWLAGFRDRSLIGSQHKRAIAGACKLGIVQGDANGWFYPSLTLTRSQVAAMLYRAFMKPLTEKPSPPAEVPASAAYPEQSIGSEGTLVYMLEARLAELHYPCGDVDNAYDERTRDAVMAFEKVEGLSRDGVAGGAVWERIFQSQVPVPKYSAAGSRVEVDLTRQVLFMITDDVVTETVHVSTGKVGTPTGHGKVWLRQQGWQHVAVGWMYYPCYFMPHIAIHGSKSVPNYPASHGCVRTPTWISPHLYEELPMSLGVDVYY